MKKFTKERIIDENAVHQDDVRTLMTEKAAAILIRGGEHDWSKNGDEPVKLLVSCLNKEVPWGEWNEYHFKKESHHPEFYSDVTEMSLVDLIEMVIDGACACYRRNPKEPILSEQVAHFFKKRFDLQLSTLLANEFMKAYREIAAYTELNGTRGPAGFSNETGPAGEITNSCPRGSTGPAWVGPVLKGIKI